MRVDIEVNVPKGYRVIGFGQPSVDQPYLHRGEIRWGVAGMVDIERVIVEEINKFTWSEVLKPGWVAIDARGACWYANKPKWTGVDGWLVVGSNRADCNRLSNLNILYPDFIVYRVALWQVP